MRLLQKIGLAAAAVLLLAGTAVADKRFSVRVYRSPGYTYYAPAPGYYYSYQPGYYYTYPPSSYYTYPPGYYYSYRPGHTYWSGSDTWHHRHPEHHHWRR